MRHDPLALRPERRRLRRQRRRIRTTIAKRPDGVTEISRRAAVPIAASRFICPCCLGHFSFEAHLDGRIVLTTVDPVKDLEIPF
jgi:hypothetical protein